MKHTNVLIIFARNLIHGKVKTRLAATIGADKAFEVYKHLLAYTRAVTQYINADKLVYYSDNMKVHDIWNEHFLKAKQEGVDLGERMMNAFGDMFALGYKKALIIGTDCASLDEHIIHLAFEKLDSNDLVIGPAFDGGYYLLGIKKMYLNLFEKMEWSTPAVFETTIATAKSLGLTYFLLPSLHDIDKESDLVYLNNTRI